MNNHFKVKPIVTRSNNENGTRTFHLAEELLRVKLEQLLYLARLQGFVISVESVPLEPLAMGNHMMVGHVRPELVRDSDGNAI